VIEQSCTEFASDVSPHDPALHRPRLSASPQAVNPQPLAASRECHSDRLPIDAPLRLLLQERDAVPDHVGAHEIELDKRGVRPHDPLHELDLVGLVRDATLRHLVAGRQLAAPVPLPFPRHEVARPDASVVHRDDGVGAERAGLQQLVPRVGVEVEVVAGVDVDEVVLAGWLQ